MALSFPFVTCVWPIALSLPLAVYRLEPPLSLAFSPPLSLLFLLLSLSLSLSLSGEQRRGSRSGGACENPCTLLFTPSPTHHMLNTSLNDAPLKLLRERARRGRGGYSEVGLMGGTTCGLPRNSEAVQEEREKLFRERELHNYEP